MTLNNRHIDKSSFTPSPAHTALRRIAKVVAIIIGAIVGIVFWLILKPLLRGVGWIISVLTAIMIIYWLLIL